MAARRGSQACSCFSQSADRQGGETNAHQGTISDYEVDAEIKTRECFDRDPASAPLRDNPVPVYVRHRASGTGPSAPNDLQLHGQNNFRTDDDGWCPEEVTLAFTRG